MKLLLIAEHRRTYDIDGLRVDRVRKRAHAQAWARQWSNAHPQEVYAVAIWLSGADPFKPWHEKLTRTGEPQ